jgi:polyferredoxin
MRLLIYLLFPSIAIVQGIEKIKKREYKSFWAELFILVFQANYFCGIGLLIVNLILE